MLILSAMKYLKSLWRIFHLREQEICELFDADILIKLSELLIIIDGVYVILLITIIEQSDKYL